MTLGFGPLGADAYGVVGPDYGVVPTLYASRWSASGYTSRASDTPPDTLYRAAIISPVEISQSVGGAAFFGGGAALTWGGVTLANGDGALDTLLLDSGIDRREMRIRVGAVSARSASDLGFGLPPVSLMAVVAGWTPDAAKVTLWCCGNRAKQLRLAPAGYISGAPQFRLESGDILDLRPAQTPSELWPPPLRVEVEYKKNWTVMSGIAASVMGDDRSYLEGNGKKAIARSDMIAATYQTAKAMTIHGLFFDVTFAQSRANQLMSFIERRPRTMVIVTDRYLGQIEIGMTGAVLYDDYRMSSGWMGTVVAYRETVGRSVELTMIG